MKSHTRTSEDGRVKKQLESEDSCRGFYDVKDILEEHADLDPKEIN